MLEPVSLKKSRKCAFNRAVFNLHWPFKRLIFNRNVCLNTRWFDFLTKTCSTNLSVETNSTLVSSSELVNTIFWDFGSWYIFQAKSSCRADFLDFWVFTVNVNQKTSLHRQVVKSGPVISKWSYVPVPTSSAFWGHLKNSSRKISNRKSFYSTKKYKWT